MRLHRAQLKSSGGGNLVERQIFRETQKKNGALLNGQSSGRSPNGGDVFAGDEYMLDTRLRVSKLFGGGVRPLIIPAAQEQFPKRAAAIAEMIRGEIHSDTNEPRIYATLAPKTRAVLIGSQEAILRERIGGVLIPEQRIQNAKDAFLMQPDQFVESIIAQKGALFRGAARGCGPCQASGYWVQVALPWPGGCPAPVT